MMQYICQTISEIQISYIELNVNNFTLFAKDSVGYHPRSKLPYCGIFIELLYKQVNMGTFIIGFTINIENNY